jgi:hypothetical protein
VYLADVNDKDIYGKKVRGNEEWRESILLGSKLCSVRDIQHRINKANIAFHTYKKVWLHGSVKLSESRKLKLYEALVTSVLMYNCSSWSAPQHILESIDVQQRKHLRQIIKVFWPRTISNSALYKRCNVRPLTRRVEISRWRMLGHVLRSGKETPAFLSFKFAFEKSMSLRGRKGRPRSNLFDLTINDLKIRSFIVDEDRSLAYVMHKAMDRKLWRQLE